MGEAHIHPNPRPVDEFGQRWYSAPSKSDIGGISSRNYAGNSYIIDNLFVIRVGRFGRWDIIGTHEEVLGSK